MMNRSPASSFPQRASASSRRPVRSTAPPDSTRSDAQALSRYSGPTGSQAALDGFVPLTSFRRIEDPVPGLHVLRKEPAFDLPAGPEMKDADDTGLDLDALAARAH